MIDQTPFGQHVEFVDNPEPRCPCVLLLDTSASMSGEPIRQLQVGLDQYRDELLGDSLARKRVEVAIITFGNTVQVAHDFTTADALQIPMLQPNGSTPMAGALLEAARMVDRRKQDYKAAGITYYRPWIFLITDGAPRMVIRLGRAPSPNYAAASTAKVIYYLQWRRRRGHEKAGRIAGHEWATEIKWNPIQGFVPLALSVAKECFALPAERTNCSPRSAVGHYHLRTHVEDSRCVSPRHFAHQK